MKTLMQLLYLICTATALLALPSPGRAQAPGQAQDEVRLLSLGRTGRQTCADLLRHQRYGGQEAREDAAWLLGYFAVYNEHGEGPRSFFFPYDEQNLVNGIYRHCAFRLQTPVGDATSEFLRLLRQPR